MDSGSSTPSSMVPSAGASPRRWSSFGTKAARISEEGGRLLRRASEAAGIAEVGSHIRASTHTSGDSSPDEGNAACSSSHMHIAQQRLSIQSAWLLTLLLAFVCFKQKCVVWVMVFMPCMPVGCCKLITSRPKGDFLQKHKSSTQCSVFTTLLCCAGQQAAEGLEARAKSMDTAVTRQMLRLKASPMRVSADNLPLGRGSPRLKVSKVYQLHLSPPTILVPVCCRHTRAAFTSCTLS